MSEPKKEVPESQKTEAFLKKNVTFTCNKEEYTFKIPTAMDRIRIGSVAANIRRQTDPTNIGAVYGYDPGSLLYVEYVSTILVLLEKTSALWPYSVGDDKKPKLDPDAWPDDAPIVEVIEQFNKELESFREARARHN